MAERKQGPVKPPVIDLTPNRTGGARPPRTVRAVRHPAPEAGEAEPVAPAAAPQPEPEPVPPQPAEPAVSEAILPDAPVEPVAGAGAEPAEAVAPSEPVGPARDEPEMPEPAGEAPEPPPRPRPPAPPQRMPNGPIYIAAIAGALLGTVLTLGLAGLGLFPTPPPVQLADPALAEQAGRIDTLAADLARLDSAGQQTLTTLDQRLAGEAETTAALRTELAALREDLAASRAATPPAIDLAPVTAEIARLQTRLDALAAGASTDQAGAFAETLTAVQSSLDALAAATTAIEARVATLETAPPPTPAEEVADSPALPSAEARAQLPVVVSGLESAFASGRSYADELAALRTLLPGLAVPEPVSAAAANGLPRPVAVIAAFEAAVPDMLAARPMAPSDDWQRTTLDWVTSLLALRPTTEIEGDSPDAVLSRLEAAMRRADFAAATQLFAALPEPMRLAAGTVPQQVAIAAAADGFTTELRRAALAPLTQPAEAAQ